MNGNGCVRNGRPAARAACWALVLAAGEGRRFGGAKLLAPLRGRPVVQHVLAAVDLARLEGILAGGVAVIPAGDERLRDIVLAAGLLAVPNEETGAGLARSVRLGLAALERPDLDPAPDAAVLLLGDQPLVRARVIAAVVDAWRESGAVAVRPVYVGAPGEPGHPVVLDRSAWALARRLEGDAGLGEVLREAPGGIRTIEVAGANPDVDEPDDLRTLETRL